MENIPLGFWLYALGVGCGMVSMLVPCALALLSCRGLHEISAGGVSVKASSPRQAQTLFLAALDAHNKLQQRAALARTAAFRSGLAADGVLPSAHINAPMPPHGAMPSGRKLPQNPTTEKGAEHHDGTESGKRRPGGRDK